MLDAPRVRVFIHDSAVVTGDVVLHEDTSVWPTAVIRGDVARISIGARSNVQDGAVIHADAGVPTVIGASCVIGHRAIVHGAILEECVLIGMGAIVLNHAHIGTGSIVGAGAVVTEGMRVPPRSLVLGVPARVVRALDAAAEERTRANADRYVALAERYRRGEFPRHEGSPMA
jgi:carbonic anhydrase/acetyltransferase-like protein (isoleucine patch superfamily)